VPSFQSGNFVRFWFSFYSHPSFRTHCDTVILTCLINFLWALSAHSVSLFRYFIFFKPSVNNYTQEIILFVVLVWFLWYHWSTLCWHIWNASLNNFYVWNAKSHKFKTSFYNSLEMTYKYAVLLFFYVY